MVEEPERYRVEFASGTAASVEKRRSYRDLERNDIERDLPGWPSRPPFRVRGFFGRLGRYALTVVTRLLLLPLYIIADALGSPVSPERRGKLEERENEVDDFPVMWAGEGETARTLPWQLDPSRRSWRTGSRRPHRHETPGGLRRRDSQPPLVGGDRRLGLRQLGRDRHGL
jgi:hypothetical protein